MKKSVTASFLAAGLLPAASTVHAIATFRLGPTMGYNRSFGSFEYPNQSYLKVTGLF